MKSKRKCCCCQVNKNQSCFGFKNKKLGTLQSRRKKCQAEYHQMHYQNNKQIYCKKARINNIKYKQRNKDFINTYKADKGCGFCGERTPVCLDFHHKNPKIKDWNISLMSRGASSINTIKKRNQQMYSNLL